ncbi:MAG: site-2 protease family protein, partial [Planctomycetota bacterium]
MLETLQDVRPLEVGLAAVASVYFSTWIHEGGHALAGTLAGFRITSVGTGFGKPLLRLSLRDVVLFVSLRRPFQGITTSVRDSWPTRRISKGILLLGGLAANFLAAAAAWLAFLLLPFGEPWFLLLALVNASFAALALLPASINLPGVALRTDASQVIALFSRKRKPRESFFRIRDSEHFIDFLEKIGDRFGAFHYRVHLATNLAEIGNHDRALETLEGATEDLYPGDSHMGALFRVIRGSSLLARGREEQALENLRVSEAFFREVGAPSMMEHVDLLRAQRALDRGDVEEARDLAAR